MAEIETKVELSVEPAGYCWASELDNFLATVRSIDGFSQEFMVTAIIKTDGTLALIANSEFRGRGDDE